jgi:hypothetical protein
MRSREISKCVCTGSDQIQKCIIYMLLIELRLNFTFPDVNIPRAHTREISKCVCTGSDQIQKCIIYMLLIELRLNFTFPDVNIPRAHTV